MKIMHGINNEVEEMEGEGIRRGENEEGQWKENGSF